MLDCRLVKACRVFDCPLVAKFVLAAAILAERIASEVLRRFTDRFFRVDLRRLIPHTLDVGEARLLVGVIGFPRRRNTSRLSDHTLHHCVADLFLKLVLKLLDALLHVVYFGFVEGDPFLDLRVTACCCSSARAATDSYKCLNFVHLGAHKPLEVVIIVTYVLHCPLLQGGLSLICLILNQEALLLEHKICW